MMSRDVQERASYFKDFHVKLKTNIKKKLGHYMTKNVRKASKKKKRKKMVFESGNMVDLRNKRLPSLRKFKLQSRGNGPFKNLEQINDNSHKMYYVMS